ncbi:hypothetical protein [Cryobacterium sp. TMS1-13-1]|uniref:hypothetical protein n=1 Tax=Cryobacterium sp. TMS1-13-1 TaxID=1259220 RepID=UPI0015824585|nr:hypothetical protein [Cryobacterium sp. TMS1-13-1]
MIPMMAALLISSIGSGWLVSKFGRYKWMPIAVPGRCYREPMRTLSPRPNRPAAA